MVAADAQEAVPVCEGLDDLLGFRCHTFVCSTRPYSCSLSEVPAGEEGSSGRHSVLRHCTCVLSSGGGAGAPSCSFSFFAGEGEVQERGAEFTVGEESGVTQAGQVYDASVQELL